MKYVESIDGFGTRSSPLGMGYSRSASQISKNQGYHETEHEAMNRPKELKLGLSSLFGR
jgi:hypothetical protein